VVLGGVAEFSDERLTILAEMASAVEDFDLSEFRSRIEDMQHELSERSVGDELDRAVAVLDHYRSILVTLNPTTAF
jgi:F-type H+-transporting ATPase subunit epsilon